MNIFTAYNITEGIVRINNLDNIAEINTDAYLVKGSKNAALIDTCFSPGLYDFVRELTSLPIIVLITHGHYDHVGQSCIEFINNNIPLYMSNKDNSIPQEEFGISHRGLSFININDKMISDLGGRSIEAFCLPGHTPGSVMFFDKENKILFSGDAIGSGPFWMQLPHSLTLSELLKGLNHLEEMVKNYYDIIVLQGHFYQSEERLRLRYIQDVHEATKK